MIDADDHIYFRTAFVVLRRRRKDGDLQTRGFGKKNLNSDGHLITEDSVLPTTAPGGAPERNRCYQTPATLLILPLAPASLARSAHLAPLTSLRPRWGLALFDYARRLYRRLTCSLWNHFYAFSPCVQMRLIFPQPKLLQMPKACIRSELRVEKP